MRIKNPDGSPKEKIKEILHQKNFNSLLKYPINCSILLTVGGPDRKNGPPFKVLPHFFVISPQLGE